MTDLFGLMGDNMVTYLFGSELVAGLFLLGFFTYVCFKVGLSLDGFVVVMVPLLALLSFAAYGYLLNTALFVIVVLILAGVVMFAAYRFFNQ